MNACINSVIILPNKFIIILFVTGRSSTRQKSLSEYIKNNAFPLTVPCKGRADNLLRDAYRAHIINNVIFCCCIILIASCTLCPVSL